MTIHNRLTLWFGGILVLSLGILSGVVHYEWVEQQKRVGDRNEPDPAWEEVAEVVLFYGLPTALLLIAGGWLLLRKSFSPVAALTAAAERINLENLSERLPSTHTSDELERLTDVFNAMMGRLEDSFSRVRDFTLNASHELKTPLTVMRVEIEDALRHDGISPAHHDLLANQLEEIERLTKIVDGLTLLAKADAGQLTLNRESVRFDELVQDSFTDAQMLGQARDIRVEFAGREEVTLYGDRHRLRQLLLNLTDNAIKYNRAQGRVIITLKRNGVVAELSITNTGFGIPAEKLPRIFDRFFRCDPAHSNEVEGCGLGLSISQCIVKKHGGEIVVWSESDNLTTVTVTLPLPSLV